MGTGREPRQVWAGCDRAAVGDDPRSTDPRATLLALAERAPALEGLDRYGGGDLAERLERRVADLLGKEAAVWMPSGTMAQQIALRLHREHSGRDAVGFHAHCHLDVREERAYAALHGLRAAVVGDRDRLIATADLELVGEPLSALLLELPQRDLGGELPTWDDLVQLCAAARQRGAALHLDGARLWQCPPYYERALDEIAGLFDTVYVSFYKDLCAPAGAALAGPRELIDEARVWQVRHGGRLFTVYPFMLAAERGLDERLPEIPRVVAHARELGAALSSLDDVQVAPDPPQVAMFHALARRPHAPLRAAALELAEETGVWFAGVWSQTADPAVQRTELSLTPENLAVPLEETLELWRAMLARADVSSAPAGTV